MNIHAVPDHSEAKDDQSVAHMFNNFFSTQVTLKSSDREFSHVTT